MHKFLLILLVGCTDYDFKNVEDSPIGGDESETPTESNGEGDGEESEEDTDTPDDPIDETEDDDCIETYVNFDIDEVSTLQDAVSYSVANWSQDAACLSACF